MCLFIKQDSKTVLVNLSSLCLQAVKLREKVYYVKQR